LRCKVSPGAYEIRYSLGTDTASGKRRIAMATVRRAHKDAEKELRRVLRSLDTASTSTRLTVRE
jgi:hypothetical protein